MSAPEPIAVLAVHYLLQHNTGLLTVVPLARIFTSYIPMGTTLPALCVNEISTTDEFSMSLADPKRLPQSRIQVTVQAKTYADQKAVLELARKALPNQRGTVNGVEVDSILPDGAGPDLRNDDDEIFMQSRDFLVRFTQAAA